jgi:helicase MOV-10
MNKTQKSNGKPAFRLPRKGNAAIRITAPKTKSRPPALSPSEELARVFAQDTPLEKWPKPGASANKTDDHAPSAHNATRRRQGESIEMTNGESQQVPRTSTTGEAVITSVTVTAQVVKISASKQTRGQAVDFLQVSNDSELTQHPSLEQRNKTNELPTDAASQQPMPKLATPLNSKDSSLDVHANNYVPQYLKAINECRAQIRCSIGLPVINYAQYISSFAGYTFLQLAELSNHPSINRIPPVEVVQDMVLNWQNYDVYFNKHLVHELQAQISELNEYAMYSVKFDTVDPTQPGLYSFIIPGIRESNPRVDLGDTILVRPWVCVPHDGLSKLAEQWYAENGPNSTKPAPGFTGWEYRAVVWGLQRSKEQVILRLDGFPPDALRICNVSFIMQDHKCSPLYGAVAKVARHLRQSHLNSSHMSWLRFMLFPDEVHGSLQRTLSKGSFDISWYDKQLNFEQQKAVDAILKKQYGAIPFIISGPPGTGKTKTLVEAALQLLYLGTAANERRHLLICAPSDSAADTITTRLQAHLSPIELFRLNGSIRSFAEVPEPLMLHSYIENDLFSIPSFVAMMNFKVVVTTCRDADMLVQSRLTNADLAILTTQLSLIAPGDLAKPLRLHWSALLLDEAAQATEVDALIPLTVVQPCAPPPEGFHSLPQFIMAGDEHQLGPRLSLRTKSGLHYTLFQRLFERPIYANHPLSRKEGSKPLTAAMLPLIRPPFVNLVRNYRSHPAILSVPSILFYHDTLMPEVGKISDAVALWQGWKGALQWPVLFVQSKSEDLVESVLAGNGTGAGALFNAGEVVLAQSLVASLLIPNHLLGPTSPILRAHEITVISPFRAQVNHLRIAFRAAGLRGVNIGPLEAFQGLESRVVVLCTTRTRTDYRDPGKFIRQDQARGIGLIGDAKRFNVALTRAREGLIVIGDGECLTCTGDKAWAAFIAFCERNGCVWDAHKRGISARSDTPPGRMEKALRYAAEAKKKEEEARAVPTGFGYASPARGLLRGQLPTSDEAMWEDGIRLAEENDVNDAGEEDAESADEDVGQVEEPVGNVDEDYGYVLQAINSDPKAGDSVPISPTGPAPPTVTVTASGKLTSIPAQPGIRFVNVRTTAATRMKVDDTSKLISLTPELEVKGVQRKESTHAANDPVFDRDLETEIKKEGCEMQ